MKTFHDLTNQFVSMPRVAMTLDSFCHLMILGREMPPPANDYYFDCEEAK